MKKLSQRNTDQMRIAFTIDFIYILHMNLIQKSLEWQIYTFILVEAFSCLKERTKLFTILLIFTTGRQFTRLINNDSDGVSSTIWKQYLKIKDKLCTKKKNRTIIVRIKRRFVSCLCFSFIRIQSDYCL